MRDRESESETKVPLLGDIPVLGWLFKNTSKTVEKVNILYFLTPKILANYQKDSSETVKDVLNRRSKHLKGAYGGDDPYGTTIKGIYDKAEKQGEGPLYEEETNSRYEQETIEGASSEQSNEDKSDLNAKNVDLSAPNYKEIIQKVGGKKSSIKKDNEEN